MEQPAEQPYRILTNIKKTRFQPEKGPADETAPVDGPPLENSLEMGGRICHDVSFAGWMNQARPIVLALDKLSYFP